MATTYSWKVNSMMTIDASVSEPNYVVSAAYTVKGEDGEYTSEIQNTAFFEVGAETDYPVPGRVLTGEDARPIGHANRRGHEDVVEDHSAGGQAVDVGCLDDLITHAPQGVPTLVVGQEHDDIGAVVGRGHVVRTDHDGKNFP